jgi:hypothetical protein
LGKKLKKCESGYEYGAYVAMNTSGSGCLVSIDAPDQGLSNERKISVIGAVLAELWLCLPMSRKKSGSGYECAAWVAVAWNNSVNGIYGSFF